MPAPRAGSAAPAAVSASGSIAGVLRHLGGPRRVYPVRARIEANFSSSGGTPSTTESRTFRRKTRSSVESPSRSPRRPSPSQCRRRRSSSAQRRIDTSRARRPSRQYRSNTREPDTTPPCTRATPDARPARIRNRSGSTLRLPASSPIATAQRRDRHRRRCPSRKRHVPLQGRPCRPPCWRRLYHWSKRTARTRSHRSCRLARPCRRLARCTRPTSPECNATDPAKRCLTPRPIQRHRHRQRKPRTGGPEKPPRTSSRPLIDAAPSSVAHFFSGRPRFRKSVTAPVRMSRGSHRIHPLNARD
jgi:hypothetical protein